MAYIKSLAAKYLQNLAYFYKHLGYRLFVMIFLGILVGVLDGFGLAMFMPLLEMVSNAGQADGSSLGKLAFLVSGIENLGLSLNIHTILLIMVLFFILKGIIQYISQIYRALIRKLFIYNLRNQLLNAFNQIRYKYFVISDIGRIQNTMTVEVERASSAFTFYTNTLQQSVMVMVYLGFAFFMDVRFALLVTIGGALTNILHKVVYKRTKGTSQIFSKDSHLYQGQIIQYVANFKYLKATSFLNAYANRLRESINIIEQSRFRIGKLNALLLAVREPLLIIVVASVILIQTEILNENLGPILISLLFFYRALSSLLSFQSSYNRFLELFGSLENLKDFEKEIIREKEYVGKQVVKGLNNSIKIQKASLAYNNINVLVDIDLVVKKNETIAFVGESGSGKTTLVNIIAGLMPVDSGNMFIDGINRKEISMKSYQERIGYITQDPVIFNDTIFNNVTLWAEPNQNNFQRFEEALKKSAINTFVEEQPNGADTILGNDGVNISGGQKQRISIARELYKDIDLLIMDEATSALDSETERAIQESIDALKGSYTILIVAHRLSTIRNVDRVVLMSKGKIEQTGTFDELNRNSPTFRKMIELQEL